MKTFQQKPQADPNRSYASESKHFWKLFHNLIQHGNSQEETTRSQVAFEWLLENLVTIRQVIFGDQLELIGLIHEFGMEHKHLPSLKMLNDILDGPEHTKLQQALEPAIEDYNERKGELKLFGLGDLSGVLTYLTREFENEKLTDKLAIAQSIIGSPTLVTFGKRKVEMYQAKDALGYLMRELQEGILVNDSHVDHPICVQNEAQEIGADYDEQITAFPTGFDQIQLYPGDFMGILGYLGGGKSTLSRFMAYQCAQAGYNVCHVSLEEEARKERNRYVLLHAHNPKFNGEFDSITFQKVKKRQLSVAERSALDFIAADFKETIGGKLIIRQPFTASWEHVRTEIELQDMVDPLDVVLLDYVQLLEPSAASKEDARIKMGRMVKNIRQFGLAFQPNRKLAIISPVQANEDGLKKAADNEGVWRSSAINNDKELGRSMNVVLGVFDYGEAAEAGYAEYGGMRVSRMSSVKDRDAGGFAPFIYGVSGVGWIKQNPSFSAKTLEDLVDNLGDEGTPLYGRGAR